MVAGKCAHCRRHASFANVRAGNMPAQCRRHAGLEPGAQRSKLRVSHSRSPEPRQGRRMGATTLAVSSFVPPLPPPYRASDVFGSVPRSSAAAPLRALIRRTCRCSPITTPHRHRPSAAAQGGDDAITEPRVVSDCAGREGERSQRFTLIETTADYADNADVGRSMPWKFLIRDIRVIRGSPPSPRFKPDRRVDRYPSNRRRGSSL